MTNVKIGDHQTVYFSIKAEEESAALEKYDFNFRRTNFDAMFDEMIIQEQLTEVIDVAQGFEILMNRFN